MKFFPKKFFIKLSLVNIFLGISAIIITAFATRYHLKNFFEQQLVYQLRESLENLKESLVNHQISPVKWCQSLSPKNPNSPTSQSRYTVISESGQVLCDNQEGPELMDNHADRPEFRQALQDGWGVKARFGHTQQKMSYYGAIPLEWHAKNGRKTKMVIRKSIPLDKLDQALLMVDKSIGMLLIPLFILFSIVSVWRGISLSRPMGLLLEKITLLDKEGHSSKKFGTTPAENEWDTLDRAFSEASHNIQKQTKGLVMEKVKLSTLLNSLSDAIVAVDKEQTLLFYNPVFQDNFLGEELGKREGVGIWEVFRNKNVLHAFANSLEKGEKVNLKDLGTENRTQYYSLVINPLKNSDKDQEIMGAVAVFYDMTKITKANQMRVDFVANISHEVRTPLTAIQGSLDLLKLRKDELTPMITKYVDKISRNTNRLFALFQDLLKLSLLESETDLELELIELKNFTELVLGNLKSSYPEKILDLQIDCRVESAFLDKNLLEQVLTNLVENTFKYVPQEGRVQVIFKAHHLPKANEEGILLIVKDNGPGIPPEHQTRVFERFYRVESSRSKEIMGTGLGLSIVKHAVLRHRGKVWVESLPTPGTSFHVYFPQLKPWATLLHSLH